MSRSRLVAFLTAVLVLAFGGAAVGQVARSSAVARTNDKATLALLDTNLHELQAIEWQAIGGQRVEPGMLVAAARLRVQAAESLAQLPQLASVAPIFRAYNNSFDEQLRAIESGDFQRASELENGPTDARARALNAHLAAADGKLAESASNASLLATIVMWLAAFATALGTGFLAWRVMRASARTARAEADRRVAEARYTQARELERAKDDFVATVSHELRTPLTSIIGYLELLAGDDDGLSPDHRAFVDVIDRNASRLLALVSDLLTVAQAEAGRLQLAAAAFTPGTLVDEAVASARPGAETQGVTLTCAVEPMPELVGDRARLAQILDNLIANAVKFTPAGGSISVRARRAGGRLELEVADTGVGIPADELEHLFDRFYRAAAAQRSAVQGLGLGLSIVKLLAEAHGGSIDVVSRVGAGTMFTVVLPLPAAPAEVAHAA